MIEHVTVTASDFAASVRFYDAALGALGLVRLAELVDEEEDDAAVETVGWGPDDGAPVLWVVAGASADDRPASPPRRLTLDAQVETFHRACRPGRRRDHAAPRRWTPYRRGEFGAMVRDPDGNLIEVVAPE